MHRYARLGSSPRSPRSSGLCPSPDEALEANLVPDHLSMQSGLADAVADAVVMRLQSRLQAIEMQLDALGTRSAPQIPGSMSGEQAGINRFTRSAEQPAGLRRASASLIQYTSAKELNCADPGDRRTVSRSRDGAETGLISTLEQISQGKLSERDREGSLAWFVDDWLPKPSFAVIFVNTAFTWYTTDFVALHRKPELKWMERLELAFLAYYTTEVVLKLIVHRCWFFWNNWNIFDFTIVLLGIIQTIAEACTESKALDVTFLRACRIFRILRMFKTVRYLSELRLMANCVAGSITSLFWATCFLGLMLMITALVFVQSLSNWTMEHSCKEHSNNPDFAEHCENIFVQFGSVQKAMLVLLQSVTGGTDWLSVYEVVEVTGVMNSAMFLAFIIFFTFAFFNIIMSIFVEKAMKLAKPEEEELLVERSQQKLQVAKELRALLTELDKDCSGTISLAELEQATQDELIRSKFELLDITIREAEVCFQTVSSLRGIDEVAVDQFVNACMKMKGPAASIDVQAIGFQVNQIVQSLETLAPPLRDAD